MKRVQMLIMMMVAVILITACNAPENYSTKTYVKDLVATDVFEAIANPDLNDEIELYDTATDISGEYLELAEVKIEDVSDGTSKAHIKDILKQEALKVGGNGVLIVEHSLNKKDGVITQKWSAIAIYAFEVIPENGQIVML